MSRNYLERNPLISKAAGFGEDTAHFFIQDADHPYVQEKPFDWIRGYRVGGKSIPNREGENARQETFL